MSEQPKALRLADLLMQKERRVDVYILNDASAELRRLQAENKALRSILTNAAKHAEWREKYIYYIKDNGEVDEPCQNWLLYVYLRVPLDEPDKSVKKALEREINSRMEAK